MKIYAVTLSREEREILNGLVSKGKHASQRALNALILFDCDTGDSQINHLTHEYIITVFTTSIRKIEHEEMVCPRGV